MTNLAQDGLGAFLFTAPYSQVVVGGSLPPPPAPQPKAAAKPSQAKPRAPAPHGRSAAAMLSLWEESPATWLAESKTSWSAFRRQRRAERAAAKPGACSRRGLPVRITATASANGLGTLHSAQTPR